MKIDPAAPAPATPLRRTARGTPRVESMKAQSGEPGPSLREQLESVESAALAPFDGAELIAAEAHAIAGQIDTETSARLCRPDVLARVVQHIDDDA